MVGHTTPRLLHESQRGWLCTLTLPPHIFEDMQEEGVSVSIGSGWRPGLIGFQKESPQPGCWCQLVPAGMGTLPPHSLGRQAAWLLIAVYQPRKGWILVKVARCSSLSTCINLHMQPRNSRPEGGHPHIALLWIPTFSFSLSLAWLKPPLHAASFFLLSFSVPKLNHTHHCHVSPDFQQPCKALRLVYKDPVNGELLSHSSLLFISPRETCLLFSSLRTPGTL